MAPITDQSDFVRKPLIERPMNGGQQRVYRFANGYGASVVRGEYTYGGPVGLWELAVLRWDGESEGADYRLTYETPVTDDVIGHLDVAEVEALLDQIEALPTPAVTP
mgnify:CR=1 FL=1